MAPYLLFLICSSLSKRYKEGEVVPVYISRMAPLKDSLELFDYYSLPVCRYTGKNMSQKQSASTILFGQHNRRAAYSLLFNTNKTDVETCQIELDKNSLRSLTSAVQKRLIYEMSVDKLPAWVHVGIQGRDNKTYVYSKLRFAVKFNGPKIIEVEINPELPVPVEIGTTIKYSYSVEWKETKRDKTTRDEKYFDDSFYKHPTRYYYMYNSLILTCILCFVTCFVLTRYLGSDLKRYERESDALDFDIDFRNDMGWKMLHNDVFRCPERASLLSVLVFCGSQLFFSVLLMAVYKYAFGSSIRKQSLGITFVLAYIGSSFVAAYFNGGFYKNWGRKDWIKNFTISTFTIPSLVLTANLLFSIILSSPGSVAAIPMKNTFLICLIMVFVVLPVVVVGVLIGRRYFFSSMESVHVGLVPRQIPPTPFYLKNLSLSFIIGLVCSSSILLEVHYILSTILQHKFYYTWGFLLGSACMFACNTILCTIIATYFVLSSENHRWQWMSFIAPFGTSLYVFLYCVYFFLKLDIHGANSILRYFTLSFGLSLSVGVAAGFLGFITSTVFVHKMFKNLKTD